MKKILDIPKHISKALNNKNMRYVYNYIHYKFETSIEEIRDSHNQLIKNKIDMFSDRRYRYYCGNYEEIEKYKNFYKDNYLHFIEDLVNIIFEKYKYIRGKGKIYENI